MDENFPFHVAIIMDGNGRWATSLGKKRTYGHYIGSKVVDEITKGAVKLGIKYLTLYTFSTENWKRPKSEIRFLMALLKTQLRKKEKLFMDNGVAFSTIGDISVFDERVKKGIEELKEKTKNNKKMRLTLALNYGGKHELTQAAKRLAEDVKSNKLKIDDMDENTFERYLYTYDMPDVDLLIRTGGEKRISNFLLWQSAYAEFVFFDKYWPEFTVSDLETAIDEFKRRKRRFGGL
ncbi:polyprenyl diphosphate synthase [Hippea alviniae]|uniref:polyprenyl diphosphate synthase n=1 Tax=Hippea alviniae TaxID=1279027 RepID=UPI0003B4FA1E|nr:polyprenyl diphosphate synthase [Hippea alviniae]